MNLIIVAIAAFGGGVLSALLGWLDSKETFNSRKFGKSAVIALLAGIGFAVGYSFGDGVEVGDVFLAILGGAGVDSLSNRVIGATRISK